MALATADIFATLHTLPPSKLRELQARASVLLGSESPADTEELKDSDEYTVHQQVLRQLADAGDSRRFPLSVARKGKNGPAFRAGAKTLVQFVDAYLKPKAGPDRIKAIATLVSVCATWLRKQKRRPFCHRTLCQALSDVSTAVEDQFPGYLGSGLLPMVLKMKGDCSDA